MRPRPKKSSAPPPTSNATRRILRQCRLRRHHTAHLWRFAPYGSCYAYGASRHTARATPMPPLWGAIRLRRTAYALVAYGNAASIRRACALCSRCLRQRGEHTRALQAPHGGAFFAYGAPGGAPYGSFFAYGAPCGRRHTAPSHGYALVAYGNAASIRRALLIAFSPRFVAGTSGSGIRGVGQIVP